MVVSKALNQHSAWLKKIKMFEKNSKMNCMQYHIFQIKRCWCTSTNRNRILFSQYLSFADTGLRERNIFSLSTVHPYRNCLPLLPPSFGPVWVLEAKICYIVKQLQQVSGHLEKNIYVYSKDTQTIFEFGFIGYDVNKALTLTDPDLW